MLKGLRDFILRGNIIDLAIAVILGVAFNAIVTSLVSDVISPLIAAIIGKPNFSYLFFYVGGGKVMIGNFLTAVINFLIVASVVYFGIVLPLNTLMARIKKPAAPVAPATKPCPQCLSEIPIAARRCGHCTQLVA